MKGSFVINYFVCINLTLIMQKKSSFSHQLSNQVIIKYLLFLMNWLLMIGQLIWNNEVTRKNFFLALMNSKSLWQCLDKFAGGWGNRQHYHKAATIIHHGQIFEEVHDNKMGLSILSLYAPDCFFIPLKGKRKRVWN